jgi:hypothetical protein
VVEVLASEACCFSYKNYLWLLGKNLSFLYKLKYEYSRAKFWHEALLHPYLAMYQNLGPEYS